MKNSQNAKKQWVSPKLTAIQIEAAGAIEIDGVYGGIS